MVRYNASTARPTGPTLGRRLRRQVGLWTAALTMVGTAMVGVGTATAAHADAAPVLDGSQSSLAAPSCWAIKQQNPSSSDGVYWLQTPQLVAPQQFYCDQTTDGGGWVLIGRGREGWTWNYNGQGSPADLRTNPTGTAAFAPEALSANVVNGLLGGTRVDALSDGVRVRRAKDVNGTTYQEMRIKLSNRPNWSWAIGGGELFSSVQVDGSTYNSAGNTQSWASGSNQQYLRMTTNEQQNHNYKMGFAYGNQIAGQNNPNSYLWTYTTEKSAIAFSQIFIRPMLTTASYAAIPADGQPASTVRSLMSSTTSPNTPWGVTGIKGATSELNMEVEAFAQIGNTMYVGGGFQNVQKGANPTPDQKIAQAWLAGFDINTGEWLSSFRPALDGQVWDLQATPDGKLVVGGQFTTVNGVADAGITELDPITGATVPTWNASVQWVSTDGLPAQVRALDYQDGWIYLGGRFNRVSGGTPVKGPITVGRAARVRVSDGQPDGTWKPNFDGSIIELDASAQGDRVYFSGYFDNLNGSPSKNIAVVSTAAGAAQVPGLGTWHPSIGSGTATYQQAIKEDGNYVWQGGSEHVLGQYSRSDYSLLSSDITKGGPSGGGGDIQAIGITNGVVYASCHCGNYAYSNDLNYSNPVPTASDVNDIQYIGAWDETTGQYLPEFYPSALDTRFGIGGWELMPDSNGCLWFGGDFTQGSYLNTGYQWLGGFGKFCPRDSTAPTVPGNLRLSTTTAGPKLAWDPSSDNSGSVKYEILRNDRVIATTTGVSYIDSTATSYPVNYWVRAIDDTGNRSATTASVTALGPDTTPPTASIVSPLDGTSVYGTVTVTASANDDREVASVDLLVDGSVVSTSTTAPYSFDWSATAIGNHTLQVVAHDAAGNSGASSAITVTVPPDTTAPSAPGPLSSAGVTTTGASLSWTAATDDRSVAGYQVLRDNTMVAFVQALSFTDSGLIPGTTYSYTVQAVDGTGNVGPATAPLAVTTAAVSPDLYSDVWNNTDGSPWASAWTATAGNGSVSTQSGTGQLAVNDVSGAYARAQLTGLATRSDSDLTTSFTWSSNAALTYLDFYLRGSGGWQNSYRPRSGYGVQFQSNSGTVVIQKNDGGATTNLLSVPGAQQVGTGKQWLRLRVSGSTIQFKVWADGLPEPVAWSGTVSDSAVTTVGQLFVSVTRGGTNVGAKSVALDDLTVRDGA